MIDDTQVKRSQRKDIISSFHLDFITLRFDDHLIVLSAHTFIKMLFFQHNPTISQWDFNLLIVLPMSSHDKLYTVVIILLDHSFSILTEDVYLSAEHQCVTCVPPSNSFSLQVY